MSNYDPFRLYSRQKTSSHKGQVLRKKFYPVLGDTYTREDLQRVIAALTAQGYQVYFPGAPPPPLPSSHQTVFRDTVGLLDIGQITIPIMSTAPISFFFSTLWDAAEPEFSSFLNASPDSISNFQFQIDILSISSWGVVNTDPLSSPFSMSLYFIDDTKSITFMPHVQSLSRGDYHISVQSLNNETVLHFTSFYQKDTYPDEILKKEGLESPFLISYLETNSSLITALKNKDYSSFNPILYNFVPYPQYPDDLIFPHNLVTFHIHLQYDI